MGDGDEDEDDFVVIVVPFLCFGGLIFESMSATETMTVVLIKD